MKIRKIFIFIGMLLVLIFANVITFESNESLDLQQPIRTIDYGTQNFDEDNLFVEFDNHRMIKNDDSISVIAQKKYNKEMFDELDLTGIENSSDDVVITYEINYYEGEGKVYLSVKYDSFNGEEDLIEVLPGLVTLNDEFEQDVLFVDGDEKLWLSELENFNRIDNVGFWSFVRKVIKVVVDSPVIRTIVNTISTVVAPIIRFVVTSFYLTGLGPIAAWIGAKALNMNQEYEKNSFGIYVPTGIYHANFNCWQQNVGYDDFYDEVFDNGTSFSGRKRMERHKYEIDVNRDGLSDYILWAWKGDYYNLGAGCELGIYERVLDDDYGLVWKCATSKAFNCSMSLNFNKNSIINWDNDGRKHWWFTGFNSNYQFPVLNDINDLRATFDVTFNSFDSQSENDYFYNDFYDSYNKLKNDSTRDWKYWASNRNDYTYYNGMKCYKATLSF